MSDTDFRYVFYTRKFVLFDHFLCKQFSFGGFVILCCWTLRITSIYSCLLRIYLRHCKFFSSFLECCHLYFSASPYSNSSLCSQCYSLKFCLLVFGPSQYLWYVSIIPSKSTQLLLEIIRKCHWDTANQVRKDVMPFFNFHERMLDKCLSFKRFFFFAWIIDCVGPFVSRPFMAVLDAK